MTPEGLVASLAWSAVTGYAAWRADLLGARWLAFREARVVNKTTRVLEQIASTERLAMTQAERERLAKLSNRPASSLELPDDLEAVAMLESEEWARDNERNLMRQRFVELFDGNDQETWQKVRSAVGIAEMP